MRHLLTGLSALAMVTLGACGAGGAASPAASTPVASAAAPASGAANAASAAAKPSSAAAKPSAATGGQAPASGVKEKVRAGFLSYSTVSTIEFASKEGGFYDKYGLDVSLSYVQPAILTTALNAGQDFDVGYASAANIPTVNVKGGDLVMIGGSAQGGIFAIDAMPGIGKMADLKGKTAAVTSSGSTTDLLLRQVLQQNGLTPEKDVGIVVIADNTAMVAALINHRVDAIVSSEPFTSMALSQGAQVIFDQAKNGERAVQTPVTVKRSYLAGHRDQLKRLLMANMEAIHLIKTNPAQAAKYANTYIKLDDPGILAKALENTGQIMDPDMNVPLDNLATSLKIAAANVPEVGQLKPEDLVDLSLLQEIKASGFIEKLYQS
jgi:NitT/TauT family transport system substrate-binding protein